MDGETSANGEAAPSLEDVATYTRDVFKAVVSATRCAKALPKIGDNYELYNSYPVFAQLMEAEGDRILQLISKLCNHAGAKTHLMDNTLLMEERMERLSEVNDFLLERVGNLLDEAAGLRRPEELVVVGPDSRVPLARTIATSWNRTLHVRRPAAQESDSRQTETNEESNSESTAPKPQMAAQLQKRPFRLLGSSTVPRPQAQFSDQIDNSNKPFVPKLRFKHNAKERRQRDKVRIVDDDKHGATAPSMETDMDTHPHPYKYELDHFEAEPWQLEYPSEVAKAKPVEVTSLVYVRTEGQLEDLCRTLKSVREFAVDLEHHSYRTFQGLTCLMQISTRTHDYIVDTLTLWRHMHVLNDPFTDPSIMKVLHGASMDIIWLQRDFGIYVVNMFDTGQAVRQLSFPRLSLAYLVQYYCGEELEKQYQMADWRIRPLPDELIMYARKDTHYLLTCCDYLRRELLDRGNEQKNLLLAVFTSSRDICSQVYFKPLFDPDDYLTLLTKSRKRFNTRQLYALKQLCAWRDHLARMEDESYPYVLPDHMLLQIAEVLPRELQGIWACCSPVPPLVRQDSHALHRIILQARATSLESSEGRLLRADKEASQRSKYSAGADDPLSNEVRSSMLKNHDFSHVSMDEEIVPLSHRLTAISKSIVIKEPSLSFFHWKTEDDGQPPSKKRKSVKFNVLEEVKKVWDDVSTPYDQYLLAVAAATKAEAKEADENQKHSPKKRKMYSHLDQTIKRSQEVFLTYEADMQGPSTSAAENTEENADATMMAKKRRKVMSSAEERQCDEVISTKIRKRKRKPKPDVALTERYDYSAADKTIFSKGASAQKANVFEPHKEFLNKRDKKKKKKGMMKKGVTGTVGAGWKKKSAAAFASFDSGGGGGSGKGKKGGKR